MFATVSLLPMSIAFQGPMPDPVDAAEVMLIPPQQEVSFSTPEPALPPNCARESESYSELPPAITLLWPPQDGRIDYGNGQGVKALFFGDWKNMQAVLLRGLREGFNKPAPPTIGSLISELRQAVARVKADWHANDLLADRIADVLHNMNLHLGSESMISYDLLGSPATRVSTMEDLISLFRRSQELLKRNTPRATIGEHIDYLRGTGHSGVPA